MLTLAQKLRAGLSLYDEVCKIDAIKGGMQASEVQQRLDRVFLAFCKTAEIEIEVKIRFCDVHALMGQKWHTELAFVAMKGRLCTLNFHTKLLDTVDPNAALIFVAKSWVLLLVLEKAIALEPDCTGSFVFEIGDNGGLDSVAFCSHNPKACLIVDYDFARSNGYENFRNEWLADPLEWNQRTDRLFWRGATTGRRLKAPPAAGAQDDLMWLHRLQLCLVVRNPSIGTFCDVGISNIVQIPESYLKDNIIKAGLLKPKVSRKEFSRYKFVFDIDGNSNAWSGLFCSLFGGSCVLKVASIEGFREWYYDSLVPWSEYVPVKSDFTDLATAVAWVRNNDSHAHQIAERGRELAERITMQAAIDMSARNFVSWLRGKASGAGNYAP